MNEVLAILYYCFQGLETSEYIDQAYIEADIFTAFSNLMVDIRDCFLRELDQEPTGINGHIHHYRAILGTLEPATLETIENNEVTHQFYCMRWFMLLMCQEFNVKNI
jgi:hypothetical protein